MYFGPYPPKKGVYSFATEPVLRNQFATLALELEQQFPPLGPITCITMVQQLLLYSELFFSSKPSRFGPLQLVSKGNSKYGGKINRSQSPM